ncbi:GUSB [Symbiodinium microadriaticum]|nr:GUSB [Symbiodinium microadriaticum]
MLPSPDPCLICIPCATLTIPKVKLNRQLVAAGSAAAVLGLARELNAVNVTTVLNQVAKRPDGRKECLGHGPLDPYVMKLDFGHFQQPRPQILERLLEEQNLSRAFATLQQRGLPSTESAMSQALTSMQDPDPQCAANTGQANFCWLCFRDSELLLCCTYERHCFLWSSLEHTWTGYERSNTYTHTRWHFVGELQTIVLHSIVASTLHSFRNLDRHKLFVHVLFIA